MVLTPMLVNAANPITDVFNSNFKLSVCDGPAKNPNANATNYPNGYVACDFNGLMLQAQHLINVFIIFGVLAAIVSFSYAGYLYITGVEKNISHAREIFRKTGIGLIMMLTAWFVVYQILDWLVADPGVKTLLGTP